MTCRAAEGCEPRSVRYAAFAALVTSVSSHRIAMRRKSLLLPKAANRGVSGAPPSQPS